MGAWFSMASEGPGGKGVRVSLGKRMRHVGSFACWGVKPNWGDYPKAAREAILEAEEVFYPSHLYEDLLQSLGKTTFLEIIMPSWEIKSVRPASFSSWTSPIRAPAFTTVETASPESVLISLILSLPKCRLGLPWVRGCF